jgi:uncharacterized protein YpuA (DUF1002 family)
MAFVARLFGFVGLSPASLALYAGLALAGVAALAGIYHAGHSSAESKCEAAALRARVAELETQVKVANGRAEDAAAVVAELQRIDVANAEQLDVLRREVEAAKLQSTKPGAQRDPNAILDDRCNLTGRGARRMRGQ